MKYNIHRANLPSIRKVNSPSKVKEDPGIFPRMVLALQGCVKQEVAIICILEQEATSWCPVWGEGNRGSWINLWLFKVYWYGRTAAHVLWHSKWKQHLPGYIVATMPLISELPKRRTSFDGYSQTLLSTVSFQL